MHVIPHAPVQLVIVFLDDLLDADDIVAVCEDGKICRFYFPRFKERSRFKGLVKAEAEENQVSTFTSSRDSPSFPAKESGYKLTSLPEIFQSALPNCACEIFRREAFNGKISPCEILVSFLLALAISLQRRVILWTVDSLVLITGATCI